MQEHGSAVGDDVAVWLWGRDDPTGVRRGRKPQFSLEQLVDCAIDIADADGLGAVTMQRIAELLGVSKMALYRYVPDREHLDAALLDRVCANAPALSGRSWRINLRRWANELFARTVAHPWAVELIQRPHTPGPAELTWSEAGLRALATLQLTPAEKLDTLALLSGHVTSLARRGPAAATLESDTTSGLKPMLSSGTYVQIYGLTATALAAIGPTQQDNGLTFGIERILDGIAAFTQQHRPASVSRSN